MKPFAVLSVALLLFSTPAIATPVTYSFESSAYNSFSYSNGGPPSGVALRGPYEPGDHLTIEITYESALPTGGNLTRNGPALVSAYAFDGINAFDETDMYFDLVTDASGAVTSWVVGAARGGPDFDGFTSEGDQNVYGIVDSRSEVTYSVEYALTEDYILNVLCQRNQTCFERERLFPFSLETASAGVSRDRATWTVSTPAIAAVPVTGSLPFMATGLLALGAWRLRRRPTA